MTFESLKTQEVDGLVNMTTTNCNGDRGREILNRDIWKNESLQGEIVLGNKRQRFHPGGGEIVLSRRTLEPLD